MFGTLADDYSVNMTLNTEMPLPSVRETVLEFFGRVQKSYPSMRNFHTREAGDFALEEDKDQPNYRWASLESRRLCSGSVNPVSVDDAMEQHKLILELAPYMLSVSPLDCEALDFLFSFDFQFKGNHDEIVAEALSGGSPCESLLAIPGGKPLNYEPSITMALDPACRRQCRLLVETRTNAYQVRKNEFPEEPITVYFTMRQYGSLAHDASFVETLQELRTDCERLIHEHVAEQVLRPLAAAIARRNS
jgi:hypothetical protein